ncbi:hypothetical protein A1O7_09295 [Cladophialophora yegresii CBS 114405]|uniref:Uncharacterized protein n=1 Tax=Cladophialophora yegresii CBS 114405 TaxID=1182544 RepID=W9VES0_9EURO|nr:uncharacterized protein A1O7_09295 [Cladophialophora yegresii CBS 114405]EXJ53958.1 hypothetical protein A1O7_09295 [Cladophialophora yegresii CBS 114405]
MSEVTLPPASVLTERLQDSKVVLVTGAASGIGFAAAQLFAQHGAKVILVDLASGRLKAAAEDIGHGCDFRACDVANWEQQVALFDWVKQTYGPPEIVCLNAGIDPELATSQTPSAKEKVVSNYLASELEPREDASEGGSQLKQPPTVVFDVNFYGVLYGIKLAVHHFPEGKGGRIVITGSAASQMGVVNQDVYVASKHALIGLMRSSAQRQELKDKNITVSMVAPWLTHTGLTANLPPEILHAFSTESSQPVDVAMGIAYLATAEKAEDVHGRCLWIRGKRCIEVEGAYEKWLGNLIASTST